MVQHERFQTVESQLNWNAPMYRLYEKAKKNYWDPANIDFSQDQEDYQNMSSMDRMFALPLVGAFAAGEEAVTLDILPMLEVMARQGRLEDTMFLTTFLHDEAKHTEMFSRWQTAVGVADLDLHNFHNDDYKRVFYQELPEKMDRLKTDDSPEAIIRAATVYNMIVEGTLAESGYHAFRQIFKEAGLMPGILKGIDLLNQDEGRHLQFGIFTIQRLVAGNDKLMKVFHDYMDELSPYAFGFVDYLTGLFEETKKHEWVDMTLKVDPNLMKEYARSQFDIRKSKVERARKYESGAELEAAATKQ
ncbi:R2-like ligand-binding oxidase [Salicibibacter cibarius]|uniref:R2-like ligand binding oxidase n=1 Tax=Salicibibacter cibarius TaxID=2743000 RepID=A0A7T7CA72_9BACI|nr:R2-like ligand-binding oxidase [Salicibibacter cibarius]QQK74594.1 R2-like ligand-binding oxidase [Salicibibacter cibarius]